MNIQVLDTSDKSYLCRACLVSSIPSSKEVVYLGLGQVEGTESTCALHMEKALSLEVPLITPHPCFIPGEFPMRLGNGWSYTMFGTLSG